MGIEKSYEIFDLLNGSRPLYMPNAPDITGNEAAALKCLADCGEAGLSMSELSGLLSATRPAATQLVDRLEAKGVACRVAAKDDRRRVYVILTEKGKEVYESYKNNGLEFLKRFVSEMGEEDTNALLNLLKKGVEIVRRICRSDVE